jgi:hypothetical protein
MPSEYWTEIGSKVATVFKHCCLTVINLAFFGGIYVLLQFPTAHKMMSAWVYTTVSNIDDLAFVFVIAWFSWEMVYEMVTSWLRRNGFLMLAF